MFDVEEVWSSNEKMIKTTGLKIEEADLVFDDFKSELKKIRRPKNPNSTVGRPSKLTDKESNLLSRTFYVSLAFSLCSCVSGKPLKNKAQYLNGENYKGAIVGVPVLKTKSKESKVFGRVVDKGFLSGAPIFGAKVTLASLNKKIIKKSTTNPKGEFVFLDQFPDGEYKLTIVHKKKLSQASFELKGYELNVSDLYLD